ncbi:MAG: Molybdenum ABC transporter permease protein ModB, partial [uncultured Nocardioidaceae bacterium]
DHLRRRAKRPPEPSAGTEGQAFGRPSPRPAATARARGTRRAGRPPARSAGAHPLGGASRTTDGPHGPRRLVALAAHLGPGDGGLPAARAAAGLGAGPGRLPRPLAAARSGDRPAGPPAGGRRRRAAHRVRAQRPVRRPAARPRHHHPLHHDRGRHRAHVRRPAVLRDQRRGGDARRQPGLRPGGGHLGSGPVDHLPQGHLPARASRDHRGAGPRFRPLPGRVRRHDHLRRQLPRHHADDAAGGLQRAPVRLRLRPRAQRDPAAGLRADTHPAPRPLALPGCAM